MNNKSTIYMEELKHKKIAVPGENTTAFMVLKRFYPECTENIEVMRFDKIILQNDNAFSLLL